MKGHKYIYTLRENYCKLCARLYKCICKKVEGVQLSKQRLKRCLFLFCFFFPHAQDVTLSRIRKIPQVTIQQVKLLCVLELLSAKSVVSAQRELSTKLSKLRPATCSITKCMEISCSHVTFVPGDVQADLLRVCRRLTDCLPAKCSESALSTPC